MPKIKLKINANTAAFFAKYSELYEMSTDEILKLILCAIESTDTLVAAHLSMWYVDVATQDLDDCEKIIVYFNIMTKILRSMIDNDIIDDILDYKTIMEVLAMLYEDLLRTGYEKKKATCNYDYAGDQEIEVNFPPEAINKQEYCEKNGITIDEVIYKEIKESIAYDTNNAITIILKRIMFAVETQSSFEIMRTIFILATLILKEMVTDYFTVEKALDTLYRHYEAQKDDYMDKKQMDVLKEMLYKHNY